ncbi:MAG: hypothetical protein U0929_13550 [Planctomycetaceae bacterium]
MISRDLQRLRENLRQLGRDVRALRLAETNQPTQVQQADEWAALRASGFMSDDAITRQANRLEARTWTK